MMKREDIVIRDPYIFPFQNQYLMTGTVPPVDGKLAIYGYVTEDLRTFHKPTCLFDPPQDFWADRDFWAPEIHAYGDKYYMFVSFRSLLRRRATQVLVADHPLGPYRVMGSQPHTPPQWHCLDGTLYVDGEGKPWMVYVREFVQMVDGEMYAQRLSDDLSCLVGEPLCLFHATWAPWCVTNNQAGFPMDFPGGYITDGPFLFTLPGGKLGMLWSSFCRSGYCQAICYSDGGSVVGPWRQTNAPLYEQDSGHGMLFTTHGGQLTLALHDHNRGISHVNFLPVQAEANALRLQNREEREGENE